MSADLLRSLCAELNHWVVELAASHPNLSDSAITWINEVADRAAAALAQPEPVAPTDEELSRRFRTWWYDEGSGLPPLPGMNHEEHTRRISEIAWANGAYVARYGTPENEPVAPTDEDLMDMAEFYIEDNGLLGLHNAGEFARAVLARWSTPANNTRGTH
jgi:hypothetical protein